MPTIKNYYRVFNIKQNATQEEINKAYHQQALKSHPDKNPRKQEDFKKLAEAYETLRDPKKRKEYDTYSESVSQDALDNLRQHKVHDIIEAIRIFDAATSQNVAGDYYKFQNKDKIFSRNKHLYFHIKTDSDGNKNYNTKTGETFIEIAKGGYEWQDKLGNYETSNVKGYYDHMTLNQKQNFITLVMVSLRYTMIMVNMKNIILKQVNRPEDILMVHLKPKTLMVIGKDMIAKEMK